MSKNELDEIYVTQKEFTPFVSEVSSLKTQVADIMKQVSNHLPHKIDDVKQAIFDKLEDIKKNNSLYLDNKINSHTRDVLDGKYADKKSTETFISNTTNLAKEIFSKLFWMLLFFFFAIVGTFIGIAGYLNK